MEIRCFIAIDVDETVHQQLTALMGKLQKNAPSKKIRWVTPENLHVTLRFLGSTDEKNLTTIISSVTEAVKNNSPFKLAIGRVAPFPSQHHAKVISMHLNPMDKLARLAESVEQGVVNAGCKPEEHKFNGHLTLARLKDTHFPDFPPDLVQVQYVMKVKQFYLYKSDTSSSGAIHTPLHCFSLT